MSAIRAVHEGTAKADPPASVVRYRGGGKRLAAALADAASGLTNNDVEQVILALVDGRGTRGASEDDMARALDWAHGAFVEWVLLRLVIEGRARIDFDADGDVIFIPTQEPATS
jgi:hypothetical protein